MAEPVPARDELWRRMVEEVRGALGGIRASVETLELHPELDAPRRARLLAAIRDESERLGDRLEELDAIARAAARAAAAGAGALPASQLLAQLEAAVPGARIDSAVEVADNLVLDVDADGLADSVRRVAERLRVDFGVDRLRLRLRRERGFGMLDLAWSAQAGEMPRLSAWQRDALDAGGEESLRARVRRGGGEVWLAADRTEPEVYLRLLLPLASGAGA